MNQPPYGQGQPQGYGPPPGYGPPQGYGPPTQQPVSESRRAVGCFVLGVLIVLIVIAFSVMSSGSKRDAVAPSPPSVVVIEPLASASAGLATAAGPQADTFSVASFDGDNLSECVELTMRLEPGADRKSIAEQLAKSLPKANALGSPCADTFKDRIVMATCEVAGEAIEEKKKTAPSDAGVLPKGEILALKSRFYRFEAISSDAMMRDCLQTRGKWTALAKDSAEYQAAERAAKRKRAEKMLETLPKQ